MKKAIPLLFVFIIVLSMQIKANNPPNTPSTPSGPTLVWADEENYYSTSATDPDGDKVRYGFDFGDGTDITWTGYVDSGSTASAYHVWCSCAGEGTRYVKVKAQDENGAESGWSNTLAVYVDVNEKPSVPSTPSGPSTGKVGRVYTFTTSSTDPDDSSHEKIKYRFDWGDGHLTWTDWYTPGETAYASHSWSSPGTYTIKVYAEDLHGLETTWSPGKVITITSNNAPLQPSLSGPTEGEAGQSYTYTAVTTDPDEDKIRYGFDWNGDGMVDEWTDYVNSGESVEASHIWQTAGVYSVKVKAQDEDGAESDWSTPLTVTIASANDVTPPTIEVKKPKEGYLYIFDKEILPLPMKTSIIIGKITIKVNATDDSGVSNVLFMVCQELLYNDTEPPYEYVYDGSFGSHTLTIRAYDIVGNYAEKSMYVFVV